MKPYSPSGPPGGETDSRGRILLVEDDPDTAEFFRHVLTKRGPFDVTHTTDPVVALVLAISEVWDLVLASTDLPAMSGYELFGALRSLAPHLPVILVAHPLDSCPPVLGIRQPEAVLAKPVCADLLLATTRAAISRPRPIGLPEMQ